MRFALVLVAALVLTPTAGGSGRDVYGANCIECHGPGGSGVPQRGPSLREAGAQGADFYLRTGYMPLGDPSDEPRRSRVEFSQRELAQLVAYVASLGDGPRIPKPHPERGNLAEGQELFTAHCAGCHQIVAQGGYVTDAVAPPLHDARPVEIAEAVRIGPYLMPRFSERQISGAQVDSIIRYVTYAKDPDDRGGWALGHLGPVPEGLVAWFVGAALLVSLCVVIGKRLRA
ncbi:MAG: c-type cytochrome [Gaiellaceae bacterium]